MNRRDQLTRRAAVAVIVLLLLVALAACGGTPQPAGTAQNAPPQAAPAQPEGEAGPAGQPPAGTVPAAPAQTAAPAPAPVAPTPAKPKEREAPAKPAEKAVEKVAEPAPPATPPPPPEPKFIVVTVKQGKNIPITLDTALSSKTAKVGDPVTARVSENLGTKAHPETVIPAGSVLTGRVIEVRAAKAMSGGAQLGFAFDKLTLPSGESYDTSVSLSKAGENTKKRTATGVGGGAAAGAVLGTIIGRDAKGALIGAAAGAAIGTGVVAAMDNKDLQLNAGTDMIVYLDQSMDVRVPVSAK